VGGSRNEILEMFLKRGYLSPDALKTVKAIGRSKRVALLEAALLSGALHADAKGYLLADALGLPFQDVDPGVVPMSLSELLPEAVVREHRVVPISREDGRLTLAAADPFQHRVFSEIERTTGLSVRVVVSPSGTIFRVIDRLYPDLQAPSAGELEGAFVGREEALEWIARGKAGMLIGKTLLRAAGEGFSSVRVFPAGRHVRVIGRKEGGSTLFLSLPGRHRRYLIAALAELAGLSSIPAGVSETVFQMESPSGVAPFSLLLYHGLSGLEAVVRILPDFQPTTTLDSVGLTPEQVEIVRKLLEKRNGLYLLSTPGPEGAATTMFAMLREVILPGARVVTVEERFRFRTEKYIQLERRDVDSQYGGRFSRLAGLLEPDAMMVETLREPSDLMDLLQVARSGVAVLCGIRGSEFGDVLRTLTGLPADPFLLSRAVRFILHQRLVDLLCPECRRPVPAKPVPRPGKPVRRELLGEIIGDTSFYMAAGCGRCAGRGFSGKMALAEVLPFTHGVQNLLLAGLPPEETIDRLAEEHLYTAVQSIRELLRRGMVTYDDILPFFL